MESKVIVFVPSQGGFVMVTYRVGEPPHDIFHPVDINNYCHPVKAFLNSEHNRIVIVCVELSSETNGYLLFVEFSLKRQVILRDSTRYFLRSSNALSEAVYASNQIFYQIFFTDVDDVYVTDADASASLYPGFLTRINNCTQTKQIDVTENEVSIYCTPNNDSWTVPAISSIPTHHTYSHYPCPGLNQYSRVENRRRVMFGNTTQQSFVGELPDDIAYAACLGSNDSLVFWAFTETGQLFSVLLTTENHTITNLSACTTEGNNCLRPSFDASKTCVAYFNHETNQVHITNITSLCGHRTVNMSVPPQLLRLTLGEKEDNCSCGTNESPTSLPASDVTVAIVVSVVSILLVVIISAFIFYVVVKYRKCSGKAVRRKTNHSQQDFDLLAVTALVPGSECSENASDNKSISSADQKQVKQKPSRMQAVNNTQGRLAGPDVGASNRDVVEVTTPVPGSKCASDNKSGSSVDQEQVKLKPSHKPSVTQGTFAQPDVGASNTPGSPAEPGVKSKTQETSAVPDIEAGAADQTLYTNYDYGVGVEVQAKEMEGDAVGDVAGVHYSPHGKIAYHPSSVAEKSKEKSLGEDNQNHNADTVRRLE